MRTAEKLKQKMFYSLQGEPVPIYIYKDDGTAIDTGETRISYADPVQMRGNIAFSTGEAEAKSYGVTVSDYDSVLVTQAGAYPLQENPPSLIWYNKDPAYLADGTVDPKSATFRIVADRSSINYGRYLLRHITG